MTKSKEEVLVNELGFVWNLFLALDDHTQDEINDFRYGIHTLQRQMLARHVKRNM